jgi:glyoxylase-like metal-dependent hydrolase (beta-lactamase superfamily II)
MVDLFLDVFPVGPIQANCVLLGDREAGVLAIIDPGEEAARIMERVEASNLEPAMVLHTHGHIDHAGGTADLVRRLPDGIPVGLHRDELQLYQGLVMQGRMFGLDVEEPPMPDLWLEQGQELSLGGLTLEVRHTPGHSPGGLCFVVHGTTDPLVIVGDVLFAGSIGRTDLMGGSFPVLEASIRSQLYTLPDDTRVICGHGPDTTIGRERAGNPFVSG